MYNTLLSKMRQKDGVNKMMRQIKKVDLAMECLINAIMEGIKEKGYEALRLSEGGTTRTTAYDGIAIKDNYDNYYSISIDKEVDKQNPYTGEIYKKEDTFNKIKREQVEKMSKQLYYWSIRGENFDRGGFTTRQEAIDDAINCGYDDFYTGMSINNDFKPCVNVDMVLEDININACDNGGEYAEDYLIYLKIDQVQELETMLNRALTAWINKHDLQPTWFTVVDVEHHQGGVPQVKYFIR